MNNKIIYFYKKYIQLIFLIFFITFFFFSNIGLSKFITPKQIILSKKENKILFNNEKIYILTFKKKSGSGWAIFYIYNTFEKIFKSKGKNRLLLNYAYYPSWISTIFHTNIYKYHKKGKIIENGIIFHLKKYYFLNFTYNILHRVYEKKKWITWKIDPLKKSTYFTKSSGFWFIKNKIKKNNISKIFYLTEIKIKKWVPLLLEEYLINNGLKKATKWIKNITEIKIK